MIKTYNRKGRCLAVTSGVFSHGMNAWSETAVCMFVGGETFRYLYEPWTDTAAGMAFGAVRKTVSHEPLRDLVSSIAYRDTDGVLVAERAYGYDAAGNVARRERERRGGQRAVDIFGYNARNELTSASLDGTDLYAYAYDAVGNRVSATETTNSWAYAANALNQYTSIIGNNDGTFIPEYDEDGNQTLVKTETGVWRVAYDAENRMSCISNGTVAIRFSRDGFGRPVFCETDGGDSPSIERYIYHGAETVGISVSGGGSNVSVNVVWDPASGMPLSLESGGGRLLFATSHAGEVRAFLSEGGGLRARVDYSPSGVPRLSGAARSVSPVLGKGEILLEKPGLYLYTFRLRNPLDGRWLSRDPAGEPGFENVFGKVSSGALFYSSAKRPLLPAAFDHGSPANEYFFPSGTAVGRDYLGLEWWSFLAWLFPSGCNNSNNPNVKEKECENEPTVRDILENTLPSEVGEKLPSFGVILDAAVKVKACSEAGAVCGKWKTDPLSFEKCFNCCTQINLVSPLSVIMLGATCFDACEPLARSD